MTSRPLWRVEKRMAENFAAILRDISGRLARASKDRKSPMQTPVIATADADVRVMVLRKFDPENWTLRFHTDARAPKCGVIGDSAPVGVLFYDKPQKIQIRVRGVGRIETDTPAVDAAWAESTNFARRCYLGEGPGAASDEPTSGLPVELEGVQPTEEQVVPGRGNFAILMVELQELDWFYLAHTGHRRAQFTRDGDAWPNSKWNGRWVSP